MEHGVAIEVDIEDELAHLGPDAGRYASATLVLPLVTYL
jgi:hypothetical protein